MQTVSSFDRDRLLKEYWLKILLKPEKKIVNWDTIFKPNCICTNLLFTHSTLLNDLLSEILLKRNCQNFWKFKRINPWRIPKKVLYLDIIFLYYEKRSWNIWWVVILKKKIIIILLLYPIFMFSNVSWKTILDILNNYVFIEKDILHYL